MRKKNFVVKLSKKPLTIKEYNRLNSEIIRNNRLGRQRDFSFEMSMAKQKEQLELLDYLCSLDVKGEPSNKNLTSEDYSFNTCEYFDRLEEEKWEFRKKMMKLLGIGAFVGGLLTAIVSYTCDFFGFSVDDTKDEIHVSSEVENG